MHQRSWIPCLFLTTGLLNAQSVPSESSVPEQAQETSRAKGPAAVEATVGQLTTVRGVQPNQLVGIGLVVGLNGTGDGTAATRQAIANLFVKNDMNRAAAEFGAGNAAVVTVTAELPAFAQAGMRVPVRVQSLNEASSLFGGELLQVPLRAGDGQVYLVAQGPLTVPGVQVRGERARAVRNHPTVGVIAKGGLVERPSPTRFVSADGRVYLDLDKFSFTTAARIAEAINGAFPTRSRRKVAMALSGGTVRVQVPADLETRQEVVAFLSVVQSQKVVPETRPVVIVNQKTGTIVIGHDVRISEVAIQIGGFNLTVAETDRVNQPAPLSRGETRVTTTSDVGLEYDPRRDLELVPRATKLEDVVKALNALNIRSHELISALRLLEQAGALHGELIIQ